MTPPRFDTVARTSPFSTLRVSSAVAAAGGGKDSLSVLAASAIGVAAGPATDVADGAETVFSGGRAGLGISHSHASRTASERRAARNKRFSISYLRYRVKAAAVERMAPQKPRSG